MRRAFLFCLTWSVGANMTRDGRRTFEAWLLEHSDPASYSPQTFETNRHANRLRDAMPHRLVGPPRSASLLRFDQILVGDGTFV